MYLQNKIPNPDRVGFIIEIGMMLVLLEKVTQGSTSTENSKKLL